MEIAKTAQELLNLRPVWDELLGKDSLPRSSATVFQNFDLNLLAARMFASREEPYIICAYSSNGVAIVPAVIRLRDRVIRLLGEELFDYRMFLCAGDEDALRAALAELARLRMPLDVVAMRGLSIQGIPELGFTPFAGAPTVRCLDTNAEQFRHAHGRLPRNLRRLAAIGYEVRNYDGENSRLLRTIYRLKAEQDPQSLFHDRERIEFMVNAALLQPELFEIFTLECEGGLGAALVTLRDQGVRRLYTGWFNAALAKHSPALSLIHHVTCETLAAGDDCDYMTGEQPYKQRLATSSHQLYRLHATSQQLSQLRESEKLAARC